MSKQEKFHLKFVVAAIAVWVIAFVGICWASPAALEWGTSNFGLGAGIKLSGLVLFVCFIGGGLVLAFIRVRLEAAGLIQE